MQTPDTWPQATPLHLSASLRLAEARHGDQQLMARAGRAAALMVDELMGVRTGPILVLAGPGNNGGDALEMAAILLARGHDITLVMPSAPSQLPRDAAQAWERFVAAGGVACPQIPPGPSWQLIVDGLFGIGLSRPLAAPYDELALEANTLRERLACPLLALDCPSGLNADTGAINGPCIAASHTLTFLSDKPGLHTADGPDHCGTVLVHGLQLPSEALPPADGKLLSPSLFAHCLTPRRLNSHKGSHGSIGILGGAHSMIGAPLLAGRAALKLGAGRVFLGLLDPQAPSVDILQPELMLRKPEGVFDADLTALACGPGLGRSVHATELLERALATPAPLVLDADALNLLAFENSLQESIRQRQSPVLLTPHPAEAARLLDLTNGEVQADRLKAALALARRFKAWIVLKGCGSLIVSPDQRWWLNTTGNPGLASAGAGDVLTGMITALLGQGWPPGEALLAATHLHGLAADDLVAQGQGPVGLCAGELAHAARQRFNRWLRGQQ